ncbi:hypothetical protein J4E91_008149 [Alternaria rosae]|nr:hypothetical protein J4E91_008149 [Alternaria rosae]
MSPSVYDLEPAVDDGQGDGTSNLGDTTATVMAHLHVVEGDMPGVTILDKFDTLMTKFAAAKRLLGGLQPDMLLQALNTVDEPDRELSKSSNLVKAYEHIFKNAHVDASEEEVSEDECETAMIAALAAVEESETCEEHTQPQYPPLNDVHRISQPPQVQPTPRPKSTPTYKTWCQAEIALKAKTKGYKVNPCDRRACPFYHEDQEKYFNSASYTRDRNAEKVGDWDNLPEHTARQGTNMRKEKAGAKERSLENKLKSLKKRRIATEGETNAERSKKMKVAATEAKATTKTVQKSTNVAMNAEAAIKVPQQKRKASSTPELDNTTAKPPNKSKAKR